MSNPRKIVSYENILAIHQDKYARMLKANEEIADAVAIFDLLDQQIEIEKAKIDIETEKDSR